MRIRSIKPEFYRSEDIAAMDWETRLVFIGLWSYVDDNGVGRDVERIIVADLFALEPDSTETLRRVSLALDALEQGGQIRRYEADGKPLLFITNWDRHQLVKNPNKPRYPRPISDYSPSPKSLPKSSGDSTESLGTGTGEQGNRGTGEGSAAKRGTRLPASWRPSDLLVQWARAKAPSTDLDAETEKFVDYWKAKAGKEATKVDWDGTWRNWLRRAHEDNVRRGWRPMDGNGDGQEWLYR